jgi:FtsP/CotA-like multicopper oxidase with cupredoxin domain
MRAATPAWLPLPVISLLLSTAAALGAAAVLLLLPFGGSTARGAAQPTPTPAPATTPLASGRLAEPPVIASQDGVLSATLVAARTRVTVGGRSILAKTYNGLLVGPTLEARPGDRVVVHLVNRLNEPTNLHFHGLHVSPAGHADNIYVSVAPGRTFTYSFVIPASQGTGTYWYHSHADMTSEEQVFGGLSGVLEVEGLAAALPPDLRGVTERVIALRDIQVKKRAIISQDIDSDAPTTRLVDGQIDPSIAIAPGETQLWHLANIGADIFYRVRLDGERFRVLAQDGNPVLKTFTAASLVMPPGKRYDVLVVGAPGGNHALRTLAYDQGGDHYPDRVLATVDTTGVAAATAPPAPPISFVPTPDLRHMAIVRKRRFVFSEDEKTSRFFINGRQYNRHRVDVRARLDTVEQWTIRNHTDEQHPFHMHTYPMQVVSVNGQAKPFTGYQDEVILPVHGRVVIRVHFADVTGETVFHCHILAHEDHGMMQNLLVTR